MAQILTVNVYPFRNFCMRIRSGSKRIEQSQKCNRLP